MILFFYSDYIALEWKYLRKIILSGRSYSFKLVITYIITAY